ncbi:MAG: hypothetical protein HY321_00075 [Armatimonadetes bacterium]|nr:hypothetical protein [Armatimonadota bacterium]
MSTDSRTLERQTPDWVRSRQRRFMVGLHVPDYDQVPEYVEYEKAGFAPILTNMDARAFVHDLKEAHVQVFYFYNKCHMGNSYYPSRHPAAHIHSALKGRDLFGELTEACRSEGIVPAAVYEFSDYRIIRDRPEWCHRVPARPGKAIDITDAAEGSRVGGACLNGPYGEYALTQAIETARDYPIEGYYVDFLGFFGFEDWRCPICGPRFREAFGFDFTGIENLTHAQYVQYLDWRYAEYDVYARRMRDAIHEVRPGVAFVHNMHGYREAPGLQTWKLVEQNCEFATGDLFHLRSGALHLSWALRGYAGASRGLPAEALLDSLVCVGGDYMTPKALDSYRAELWTCRSVNAATCTSILANVDGSWPRDVIALTRKVYEEQQAYEPWLAGMEPVATVGLVRSQNTTQRRPARGNQPQGPNPHAMDFEGWAQVLVASHQLWDVAQDFQLTPEYLRRFRVLVLPNAACLSDAECAAVGSFVRGGGRLIATGETSLFDENGSARADFALGEVMGVRYVDAQDDNRKHLSLDDPELRPSDPWVGASLFFSAGQWGVTMLPGARALGRIFVKPRVSLGNAMVPTELSGLVSHTFGEGTAWYCAGLPGAQYRGYGEDTQRRLMALLLKKAVGEEAPVVVEAPATVEVFAHRQTGRDHLVVNLVNWVTGVSRSAGEAAGRGGPNTLPNRFDEVAEMPPARDVKVLLRPPQGRRVSAVRRAPGGDALALAPAGGAAQVVLDRVGVHAMLVVEYADAGR